MRRLLASIGFLAGVAPGAARAQLCHTGPVGHEGAAHRHHGHHHGHHQEETPHHLEMTLSVEGAQVEGGAYQGVAPSLSWHRGRFGGFVVAPLYRLERYAMDPVLGPGDVVVQGHARVVGGQRWQAGALAAIGLPTGDADDHLGMGHVMLMPGLWATATRGRASLLVSTMVGRGVGGDEHAEHGSGPVVSPMNRFELGGTVRASLAVAPSLAVHALGLVGVPLDDGVTRAAVGAGAKWRRGDWSLGADAQLGVAGDPFTTRAVLAIAHTL